MPAGFISRPFSTSRAASRGGIQKYERRIVRVSDVTPCSASFDVYVAEGTNHDLATISNEPAVRRFDTTRTQHRNTAAAIKSTTVLAPSFDHLHSATMIDRLHAIRKCAKRNDEQMVTPRVSPSRKHLRLLHVTTLRDHIRIDWAYSTRQV